MLFGILAIAWPIETAIALAAAVGPCGPWPTGSAPWSRPSSPKGPGLVLMGLIALIAAFFAIFSPASPR